MRRAPLILLGAYLVAGAIVVLQPEPELAVRAVIRVQGWLVDVGAPARWSTFTRVEVMLNVALFAPVAFLGRHALPRSRWSHWVAWSFVASFGVEVVQGVFLAGRAAEYSDIVANTLGAAMGAALAALPLPRPEATRTKGRG